MASANDKYPEYNLQGTAPPGPATAVSGLASPAPAPAKRFGGVEMGVIAAAGALTILFASMIVSVSGRGV